MSEEELNKDKQELLIIAVSTIGTRLTPAGAKHFLQIIEELEKLQKELEQEKEKNEKLGMELLEKDLHIDGLKEDRRIAVEEIAEHIKKEDYISKDKIRELIKKEAYTDTYNFKTIEVSKIEKILEE